MARFCSECGSPVEGMSLCAECGAPVGDSREAAPAAITLSLDAQVAILEHEIEELAEEGWRIYGRAGPYEVCLTRRSGLTARQFLPLWVEEDGSLWTNASGAVEGGRLRDVPSLLCRQQVIVQPAVWKSAPTSHSTRSS